jgi:hypothetical protein
MARVNLNPFSKKIKYLKEDGRPKSVVRTGSKGKTSQISSKERTISQLRTYWDYYAGEGTIFASINSMALNTVMVGFILKSENPKAQEMIDALCKKVKILNVAEEMVKNSLIFGDSFTERVFNGKKEIARLKTIDPRTMIVNSDEYGDIVDYQQYIGGRLIEPPLKPENILHLKVFPIPGSPYGLSLLAPSMDTIDRKIATDESLFNAIQRHTAKYVISVGSEKDGQVPPSAIMDDIKEEFEDITSKNEFIVPWFIKIDTIDEKGIQGVREYFDLFQTQMIVGLMCPEEALGMGRGILHPDTEILVKGRGFININQVKDDDIIMTYNNDTNTMEWQQNLKTWEYDLDEDLFNIEAQTFNLLCTQDHRVLHRKQHKDNFEICQAKELPSRFEMIVGGMEWEGTPLEFEIIPSVPRIHGNQYKNSVIVGEYPQKEISMDLWLKFLGYYLSEGSTSIDKDGSYTISIKQTHEEDLEKIYEDINNLPFKIYKHMDSIRIYDKQLGEFLYPFGKSNKKYIPKHIKNLPKDKLNILYDALMFGDGCQKNYFTSSKQLADDVQEIILKMGYGSSIYVRDRIGEDVKIGDNIIGKCNFLQYTVTRNEYNLTPEICIKEANGHVDMHKLVPYKGKAYCVTVDNGLILTRLNGKCVITGNSTNATAITKAILYERTIKGLQNKLSLTLENELFKLYLDENGFDMEDPKNWVNIQFNSVTEEDDALRAKWWGNILRGFRGEIPFTGNEFRAQFGLDPIKGLDELLDNSSSPNEGAPVEEEDEEEDEEDETSTSDTTEVPEEDNTKE